MNGKITIDGYYKGEGHYETITHGGQPDKEALCSLTMRIDRNTEVAELLKKMLNYVEGCAEQETEKAVKTFRSWD